MSITVNVTKPSKKNTQLVYNPHSAIIAANTHVANPKIRLSSTPAPYPASPPLAPELVLAGVGAAEVAAGSDSLTAADELNQTRANPGDGTPTVQPPVCTEHDDCWSGAVPELTNSPLPCPASVFPAQEMCSDSERFVPVKYRTKTLSPPVGCVNEYDAGSAPLSA